MSFSRVQITSIALSTAAVLAFPAGAAVAKKKAQKYPVVTKVTPMKAGVGDLMTIAGKGFRSGKNKNTIVFRRSGQRAVFVKAEHATTTKLSLHVPLKLQAYMTLDNGQPAPSVFAIRVISKRFGQKFTGSKLSPTIGPAGSGITAPGVTPPSAYEQCLNAATANPGGDEDKDSLSNGLEKSVSVRTDPCRADTDTDGLSDGWEYQSALDLNLQAHPYPGKKPWPNPLDPTDINSDFDGDGLLAWQEFQLWQYVGSPMGAGGQLGAYSDGTQNTGVPTSSELANVNVLDLDGDGGLTDDERDADNDGLSNMVEYNTTGTQNWWSKGPYNDEKPYFWRTFADTSPVDPDSDGDGVLDSADDQDADGYPNSDEMQFNYRKGYYVQPFNPCLPDPNALTCSRYVPLDDGSVYPPFDDSSSDWRGSLVPLTWPAPTPAQSAKWFWNGSQGPQNTPDGHTTLP
jgi:hypothetical protein